MAEDAIKMNRMNVSDEETEEMIDEVKEIIDKVKPDWKGYKMTSKSCGCREGYVNESFFAFAEKGYYWIVLFDDTFAFMRISSDWVKVYSNVVLESPRIFVEYYCDHIIKAWAAFQSKEFPADRC